MKARISVLLSLICALRLAVAKSVGDNTRSEARNPVISHIRRERVGSTVIASIGYSRRRHILEIEFVNGAVYRYLEVVPSIHRELIAADSKAGFYDRNIRGSYPSVRVRPRTKR